MRSSVTFVAALLITLASGAVASAQESKLHVALKAGATIEDSEDATSGTAPALGLSAAWSLTPKWRLEAEFWQPGYLKDADGTPRHRDTLVSISAVRALGSGRIRPTLAAGYSFGRTEDRMTLCSADRVPPGGASAVRSFVSCAEPDVIERVDERRISNSGFFLLGGGLEIPIKGRVSVVADLRLSLAPAALLVRPGVGVAFGF